MKVINKNQKNVIECDCGAVIEYEAADCHFGITRQSAPYYDIAVTCPSCGCEIEGIKPEFSLMSISLPADKNLFAALTPKEIVEAAKSDPDKFRVGDTHPITLKNGWKGDLIIAAINHDVKPDGTKAPLTLNFKQLYDNGGNRVQMQKDNKAYTWESSLARQFLNNDFYALLPDEWQEVLTPVVKLTADSKGKITETTDKLYLPSEVEVFGQCYYSSKGEGEQLELFKGWINRIKSVPNGDYGMWYALRSPYSGRTSTFCGVYSGGGCNYYYASDAGCVSPCFAIG